MWMSSRRKIGNKKVNTRNVRVRGEIYDIDFT